MYRSSQFVLARLVHRPVTPSRARAADFACFNPRVPLAAARRHAPLALLLAAFTLLIRLPNFGDPTYHIDEAFYLLAGEKMGFGLLPYVDVWDRKPAGLFVLYAAIASAGSVHAYQAAAAFFAWATSLVIAVAATSFATRAAACAAGVVYLALLGALAGGGGQSPVFYNFFIALAGLLVLRQALGRPADRHVPQADIAMVLCGLALTIKPTALPEGAFFGLVLLLVRWRAHASLVDLAGYGLRLSLVAAAPTLLIWAYFSSIGGFDEYWFATMRSIFLIGPDAAGASARRLLYLGLVLWMGATTGLLGILILARRAARSPGPKRVAAWFVGGWTIFAIAGFAMVPNFYDHYALPLASVIALASAPLFDRRGAGRILAIAAIAYALVISGYPSGQLARKADARDGYERAQSIIADHIAGGCLFVYDATPALYRGFRTCPGDRFLFPEHLSNAREADAIGANPVRELKRVMAREPGIVVVAGVPSLRTPNLATRRIIMEKVARDYRKVGEAVLVDVVGRRQVEIWARGR